MWPLPYCPLLQCPSEHPLVFHILRYITQIASYSESFLLRNIMFSPSFVPGTSRMLGERDSHYTTETGWIFSFKRSISQVLYIDTRQCKNGIRYYKWNCKSKDSNDCHNLPGGKEDAFLESVLGKEHHSLQDKLIFEVFPSLCNCEIAFFFILSLQFCKNRFQQPGCKCSINYIYNISLKLRIKMIHFCQSQNC